MTGKNRFSASSFHRLLLVALAPALAACADARTSDHAFSQRDSAGISIVSNISPALAGDASWRVGHEPEITIGDEDDPEQQLFRVRGGTVRSDGSIAIGNSGTYEGRVYARDGRLMHRVGRQGQGPGELQYLENVWAPGDSLLLWDGSTNRVLVHDPTGVYLRAIPLGQHISLVQRIPDGGFIGFTSIHDSDRRVMNETWWTNYTFIRYDADGDSVNAIGPLPGAEYIKWIWQGNDLPAARALGPASKFAVDRDILYYGDARVFRILAFRYDGTLFRIVERERSPRPVTDEIRDAYIQSRVAAAPSPELGEAYAAFYVGYSFPDVLPAYDAMLVDRERNLWVREWSVPGAVETVWSVFSPEGRWLTNVRLPEGDVLEIGSDYVLMLQRSELGVERVSLFTLSKEPAAAAEATAPTAGAGLALDHIPIAVADLDAAVEVFRDRLGFSIKPGRLHANSILNAHVKFEDGTSLELITASEAVDALASRYLQSIARGGGGEFVAFRPDSMPAIATALSGAGIAFEQMSNGYASLLEFDPDGPLGHLFIISLDAPPVDRPEHTSHANGATTLLAAWFHAPANGPERALFSATGATHGYAIGLPDGLRARVVQLACGNVYLIEGAPQIRPIVGATVAVADLSETASTLEKAGVAAVRGSDGRGPYIRVRPGDANGIWLEFVELSDGQARSDDASRGTRECVPNRQRR